MGCGFSKDAASDVGTPMANKNRLEINVGPDGKIISMLPTNEDDLSDISSLNSSRGAGGDVAKNRSAMMSRAGAGGLTDLDREEDVPNIEEELFVYDDVRLARPTQWRPKNHRILNKTKLARDGGAGGSVATPANGGAINPLVANARRASGTMLADRVANASLISDPSASEVFMFSDFVCPMVDEVDFAVSINGGGGLTGTDTSMAMSTSHSMMGSAMNIQLAAGGHVDGMSGTTAATASGATSVSSPGPLSGTSTNASSATSSILGKAIDASIIRAAQPSNSGPSVRLANGTICRATNVCNAKAKQQFLQQQAIGIRAKGYDNVHGFNVQNHIGHACRVKCIAVAPGDTEFVSCSNEDSVVTLVSVKSGQEVSNFAGHQDTVISATFSADGKYLATTSRDHTMILWDVVTAKQILQFDHAKVVICCTFSRDSRFVATGCQDKVCRLWETRKGRETVFFPDHDGIIICMSYSPDNCFIASASADKTIRVWSTSTGKAKHVLRGHSGIVLSCAFTNDGLRIISNDEKLVKVWEATSGSCLRTIAVEDFVSQGAPSQANITKKLTWTLSCVAPGLFTKFIIVACNNRFVYVIDVTTGKEVASYFCKAPVYCLASGYNNMTAFGDSFGNLYLAQMV